jgi:hypothetical protein
VSRRRTKALTGKIGRCESAKAPVLQEPIDAQSQTLQRIDGSKKHGKESRRRTTRASAEEDAGFKAGKDL